MIFLKLFLTYCKIGIFNFGGGYAMIALIEDEVVNKNAWMTASEFTDIVAVSQMTPGPIGINVATYTGYTAVVNAGYESWLGIAGAFLASFAVILLPFILMLVVTRFMVNHKNSRDIQNVLSILRVTILGVIAAAAMVLCTAENFGTPTQSLWQFVWSIAIFITVFFFAFKIKINPILLILACGLIGFIVY